MSNQRSETWRSRGGGLAQRMHAACAQRRSGKAERAHAGAEPRSCTRRVNQTDRPGEPRRSGGGWGTSRAGRVPGRNVAMRDRRVRVTLRLPPSRRTNGQRMDIAVASHRRKARLMQQFASIPDAGGRAGRRSLGRARPGPRDPASPGTRYSVPPPRRTSS